MVWQMPGQGQWSPVQKEFYAGNEGQQAIWNSFMKYFLSGNGSVGAQQAAGNMFYNARSGYNDWAHANPTNPQNFAEWLQANQGDYMSEWANSSRANRGAGRGYGMRVRDLW